MPVIARTERLTLSTWSPEHRERHKRLCNTDAVMRYVTHDGKAYSDADHDEAIDWFEKCWVEHGYTFWVVERRENGEFLGICGLDYLDPATDDSFPPMLARQAAVGWRFPVSAQGHGFALEAAHLALEIGFRMQRLPQIFSYADPENDRSERLMQKLGLTRVRDLEGDFGAIVYRRSREDWLVNGDDDRPAA